jgi:molybdenum cofactor synthesis domain-containing protein
MVTVSSLCVGKELLIGKTVNTNAYWIGGRLLAAGIMLDRILTVTDSLPEISSGLKELLSRKPDFIIVVGGLGPTPDDMTLRGVAMALGRKVRADEAALELIRKHYANRGLADIEMTPARRKMAMLPDESTPVVNEIGTAPAVRIERSGTVIFCLPGVPREMKIIYRHSVDPEIRKKVGPLYPSRATMHLEGVFESTLTPAIAQAMRDYPSAYIKSHPRGLKGGTSRVELDAVVTYPSKKRSEEERGEIVAFFTEKVKEAGGTIVRKTLSP